MLEEKVAFTGPEFKYIKRGFKVGDGPEGVWEYSTSIDPSSSFLATMVLARNAAGERVALLRLVQNSCTFEGKALATFRFDANSDSESARKLVEDEIGAPCRVLMESPAAYYTDPHKSD